MESYESLSFAFKEMLRRTKTMRVRLKDLKITMNENAHEYEEMRLERYAVNMGLGYLNIEIKRTIVMLKICLYI